MMAIIDPSEAAKRTLLEVADEELATLDRTDVAVEVKSEPELDSADPHLLLYMHKTDGWHARIPIQVLRLVGKDGDEVARIVVRQALKNIDGAAAWMP
jgi:hypothetical protein